MSRIVEARCTYIPTESYGCLYSHSERRLSNCFRGNQGVNPASILRSIDESDFAANFVKYLTIDAGLYSFDDICFRVTAFLISIIPPLPPGDWNTGRTSRNGADGQRHLSEVIKSPTPKYLTPVIDIITLNRKLRALHGTKITVHLGSHRSLNLTYIMVKFAQVPFEIPYLNSEISA